MSSRLGRGAAAACAAVLSLVCGACGAYEPGGGTSAPPAAAPPSQDRLDELTVRAPGTMDGYARERFPHWSDQQGRCDTREVVLERDGEDVRTDEECAAVSGTWRSPYDDGVWSDASDVDIDHVVPLAEAWRSGARDWDDARREAFANDLERPQLLAVTDNVNQSKGDRPPHEWKPEARGYWCTYARAWVEVKHHYRLSVTAEEKDALAGMLGRCES